MGILNPTPDSFSENGLNYNPDSAINHALKMIHEGADIIDIGGESTRPGAESVSSEEEMKRVLPVIEGLRKQSDTPISIDTTKSEVAKEALKAGVDIINDVSGFHKDDYMKGVAKEYGAGCVIMHMRGTSKTMQKKIQYNDIIGELKDFFLSTINMLQKVGIGQDFICLDPGIGFSKTAQQNLFIINKLPEFFEFELPILIGLSRKSFIGHTLKIESPMDRIWGTAASVACAICRGANIIRVHDVDEMRQVREMSDAIINANSS